MTTQNSPSTESRYRPLRKLGQGGMGVVYEAQVGLPLRQTGRCALKFVRDDRLMRPEAIESLGREALIGLEVSHDHCNLVTTREFGQWSDGRLFVAMDMVDGPALCEVLGLMRGQFAMVRRIALELADVLGFLHERNVIHRDISAANILIERGTGRVKLADFGLARHRDSSIPGRFAGVREYAAPEALLFGTATPCTDLYSLGCVLYELLAGSPPSGQRLVAEDYVYPPLPGDTPADLAELITLLLQFEADKRPTVVQVIEMLASSDQPIAEFEHIRALLARSSEWRAGRSSHGADDEEVTGERSTATAFQGAVFEHWQRMMVACARVGDGQEEDGQSRNGSSQAEHMAAPANRRSDRVLDQPPESATKLVLAIMARTEDEEGSDGKVRRPTEPAAPPPAPRDIKLFARGPMARDDRPIQRDSQDEPASQPRMRASRLPWLLVAILAGIVVFLTIAVVRPGSVPDSVSPALRDSVPSMAEPVAALADPATDKPVAAEVPPGPGTPKSPVVNRPDSNRTRASVTRARRGRSTARSRAPSARPSRPSRAANPHLVPPAPTFVDSLAPRPSP